MKQLRYITASSLLMISQLTFAQQISVATGGTGGVYYPIGGAIADLATSQLEGVNAVAEVTGASAENMGLIWRQDSDFAFSVGDTAYEAYHGIGGFEGKQLESLRAVASVYPSSIHIAVLAGSDIYSLDDLKGKKVSVGAPGSGNELNSRSVLEPNGITYEDFYPQRLNFNETADALGDGDIDAGIWSVPAPASSLISLSTTRDIRLLSMSDEEINHVLSDNPIYSRHTIPGGLYSGVDETTNTVILPNVIVTNKNVSEDLVYSIAKLIFENNDALVSVHPAARDTTVEFSISSMPIPFHEGVIRYFDEMGVSVEKHQMVE
ncbi:MULTISPECIES: TAXI family TRAP transporter solute-binding subunit [Vreelandella]|uniref:TAXI family TRAP transporter solute-binding subunit n=1 Tax=Vreelandella TaxID=3137766 RepID=UPI0005CBAFAC|nr:TAXI family TRAP transporter solute-binding subunit [Halomonas meridiana]KJD18100.1 C4-dicarboxylate ABC transporter substrate-binding protein [Halomonas meridiana]MCC4288879.1 TAXI family TRAP transporter solute-binding subunit [Halomonas meridiana]